MKLRLIEPTDLSEVFDVRAATRENPFSREVLRDLGITEESTAALLRTTHRGWLSEEHGKITGFAIGDGHAGELWVMAVLPDYEGRGIGTRLLHRVEDWLWSLGWTELWLWTSSDQKKRAFSFYTKCGWTVSKIEGEILYMKKKKLPSAKMTDDEFSWSGRFPRHNFINRMRMTDASRMLIVDRITLLNLNLPVCIIREKLALPKEADAEFLQIRWRHKPVSKDSDHVVSACGSVALYPLQYVLPRGALNQMQAPV